MPRHGLEAVRKHTGPLKKMPMARYSTKKHVYALGGAIVQAANVDEPAALHLSKFLLQNADPEHPVQDALEALQDTFGAPSDTPTVPVAELAGGSVFGDLLHSAASGAKSIFGKASSAATSLFDKAKGYVPKAQALIVEHAPKAKALIVEHLHRQQVKEQEAAEAAERKQAEEQERRSAEEAAKRAAEEAARVEIAAAMAAQRAVAAAHAEAAAARDAARASAGLDPVAHREASHQAIEADAVAREAAKAARAELAAAHRARAAAHKFDQSAKGGSPRSLPELIRQGRARRTRAAGAPIGGGPLSGLLGAIGLGVPEGGAPIGGGPLSGLLGAIGLGVPDGGAHIGGARGAGVLKDLAKYLGSAAKDVVEGAKSGYEGGAAEQLVAALAGPDGPELAKALDNATGGGIFSGLLGAIGLGVPAGPEHVPNGYHLVDPIGPIAGGRARGSRKRAPKGLLGSTRRGGADYDLADGTVFDGMKLA